jgi:hypothetical protein
MNTLLLIQLIAAHLVSDFILQPDAWVESRKNNHWKFTPDRLLQKNIPHKFIFLETRCRSFPHSNC